MAQQPKALAAFPDNPGLVPRTHVAAYSGYNLVLGNLLTSSGLYGARLGYNTVHTHIQIRQSYI